MLAIRVLTSKKKNHLLLYKEFGDICDNFIELIIQVYGSGLTCGG